MQRDATGSGLPVRWNFSENNKVPLSDKPVKLAIEDIASGKVRCKSVTENDVQTSNEQAPSEIKPEK